MAAVLFTPGVALGAVNSYWRFYLAGTTTLAEVWTTKDLDVPQDNPLRADSETGIFEPVWLDDTIAYRVQALNSSGNLVTGRDFDPYNVANPGVDADDITGADAAKVIEWLGYTPVNDAGDSAADLDLTHTTPNASSAGYMGAPSVTANSSLTLAITHAGKTLLHTDATPRTYTVPPNADVAFDLETYIVIRNIGSAAVTLGRGAGVELRGEGSGTDKNWTLAQYGKAVISKAATDVWYIAGSGLT